MKPSDRNLGMDRTISRRDLLLGMGASAASAFIPGRAFADEMLLLEGRRDWGSVQEPDADLYELVVVGGGVSGLAVANHSVESPSQIPMRGRVR